MRCCQEKKVATFTECVLHNMKRKTTLKAQEWKKEYYCNWS